ncbi:hypothetical protein QOZ80_2BG0191510 [Eleusine coracana subsp. coracana]|nr:hypothetical protein QOZ80_2BG0191510 [Eleusine coracana subsp. coracana]
MLMMDQNQMAADRPLLVVHDEEEGHLVYDLLLSSGGEETVACFPQPVARFPAVPSRCYSLAVSGGTVVCAQYGWFDTLFHDTVMQLNESHKSTPVMLPMRDGSVVRIDTILYDGIYNVETLRRLLNDDGSWSWHATPLPKPPIGPLMEHDYADKLALVSAYFALGTRVWISVEDKGTFSLDTAERGGACCWRTEGTWQLPFQGRGLYVPELDSVFGFTTTAGEERQFLSACHVKTGAPPVMRYLWRDSFPWPWEECVSEDGHRPDTRARDLPSLAYLGKGRFCICRPMSTMEPELRGPQISYNASSFLVLEVKRLPRGELRLAKRGKMSYLKAGNADTLDLFSPPPDRMPLLQ